MLIIQNNYLLRIYQNLLINTIEQQLLLKILQKQKKYINMLKINFQFQLLMKIQLNFIKTQLFYQLSQLRDQNLMQLQLTIIVRILIEKMKEIYYMLLVQEHSINWLYIIRDQYKFTKLSFLLIISTQLLTLLSKGGRIKNVRRIALQVLNYIYVLPIMATHVLKGSRFI